jgi:deoxyribonuclease V
VHVQPSSPIACVDAAYSHASASAACVLFSTWRDDTPQRTLTSRQGAPAAYEPGSFYKRELPLLLAVLKGVERLPAMIIIDGYVWLDADHGPGLGAILHEALDKRVPVVGVAKSTFGDAGSWSIPVVRGVSRRPLFVSAAGIDVEEAAKGVQAMHGPHRIPTLLKLVDRAARDALC